MKNVVIGMLLFLMMNYSIHSFLHHMIMMNIVDGDGASEAADNLLMMGINNCNTQKLRRSRRQMIW